MPAKDDPTTRYNVGASPTLKRQKEFAQPLFHLRDILPGLSKQLRLDDKAKELSVLSLIDHFLVTGFDGRFAGQAKASHIHTKGQHRVLTIDANNGVVASELNFHCKSLLMLVNQYAPQTEIAIDQVKIRLRR